MKVSFRTSWQLGGLLVVGAVIIVFLLQAFGAFDLLEKKTYDLRFRLRGTKSVEKAPIVLVTIDDQSFLSLKTRWPFPRSYFATAMQNLANAGAALVILDIEFTEPSNIDRFDDYQLAQTIQKFPHLILAGKLVSEFGRNETINQYPLKPLPEFLAAGAKWAYANVYLDGDGFIRRYNLFQNLHDQQYFPLVIEALRYLQRKSSDVVETNNNGIFKAGKFLIPKYKDDTMLINYFGPANHFPTYSFANILDDNRFTLPDSAEDTDVFDIYKQSGIFKNKIVLIGASADELQDNKFTPFFNFNGKKRLMPGVEMHANALMTIVSSSYLYPANPWLMLLVIILSAGLAYVLSAKLRPIFGLATAAGIIIFYVIVGFQLFSRANIWVPLIYPLANFCGCYGINIIHKIFIEQQEKGRYRKTFQQYVARSIVDSMLNSGELPKFGGERKTLTVLFSDIRAFTSFSEKYPPEIVVQRLTEYLTSMVDVIFNNGGTLDKFVGDEIMAIYGAPYHLEDHAERACTTALDMISALRKIQKSWSQREMEYFQIGVGINTGKVIVGNLGSIQLFDYTVIGDEVNLGARLEGANKHYSTTIIISESTYNEVKEKAIVRELDNVRVKGKKRPVKIYELRGMHSVPSIEKDLIIDVYSYGLEFFKQQKWKKALSEFRRVLRYFPSDGPSRVYTMRCLEFIEKPPPENWDGVYDFLVK
ncbi:adenylate/guanylate cyclase domain-containing protein [candidate division KSB1 bacterium]|nr:adenylate/guanylate cyclase domain-containing protein [candidate division KSB1 bacterium]